VKLLDRLLQAARARQALRWIPPFAHVLDVGCADGALFRLASAASGVGVDLIKPDTWPAGPYEFRLGTFPDVVNGEEFDVVTMLAVVEHVPEGELRRWAASVPEVLRGGGRLVITTPSPCVDRMLDVGIRLHVLDGMEAEQHHGFRPETVPSVFASHRLRLLHQSRFELGLNRLFVFERATAGNERA
jgi:2-polyprenyl-3-methyl-5-hydroxy-6-metoxy-1,4-benzoquinol methylase